MSELKPCPFCGGEAKTMEQHRWWVFCPECMCDLGFEGMDESGCYGHFDTEAEAVEAWNTRHVETCTIECNERFANFAYRLYTLSCGHTVWTMGDAPNYCQTCGRKVEQ